MRFENSGFCFLGLVVLALVGFWPSYFVGLFSGTADFSFYFHFHAAMMMLWVLMLIVQPILIRSKNLALHKVIGKLSYLLFSMMLISVIWLIHQRHPAPDEIDLDITLFAQFRPFIVFIAAYYIAIRHRHNVDIHARAMIATGISIIEPALTRLTLNLLATFNLFVTSPYFFYIASIITISIILLLFVALIVKERKQKTGRWVFPVLFSLYVVAYLIAIFQIHIGLASFSKWFFSLPLT